MKKIINEFKEFIAQGNVMDLAVGIIVGGAFTSIVNSLVESIITPIISIVTSFTGDGSEVIGGLKWTINGSTIDLAAFLGAVINFMIIAIVVFLLVKSINLLRDKMSEAVGKEEEPEAEPAPVCPHCLEEVKPGATRCPHCCGVITLEIEDAPEAEPEAEPEPEAEAETNAE